MFESDDWINEDDFNNDINERTMQCHSFQSQKKEEKICFKRRKMEDNSYKVPSHLNNNIFNSKLDNADTDNIDPTCKDKNDISRAGLLLEIFQKNAHRKISDFDEKLNKHVSYVLENTQYLQLLNNSVTENTVLSLYPYKKSEETNCVKISNKIKFGKRAKLIRIFPGPAGLIASTINEESSPADLYSNSLKESEDKIRFKLVENNFSKSHDRKILFDEKAWKLLLDDLPNNFLKDYGISSIMNRANASHCDCTKVKFIAGLLDYVDHSHDDPFIILKDSTGSIEGTFHRDIPLNYPGILEPNTVILLHDVGLLKTTTYIMRNKYHILVSRINLVAIYSNKGRIICTSRMDDILSDISNVASNKDHRISSVGLHRVVSSDNCNNTIIRTNFPVDISVDNPIGSTRTNSRELMQNKSDEKHRKSEFGLIFTKDSHDFETAVKVSANFFESSTNIDNDTNGIFSNIESSEFVILDEEKSIINRSSFDGTRKYVKSNEIQGCSKLQTRNQSNKKEESVVNVYGEKKSREQNSSQVTLHREKYIAKGMKISNTRSKDKIDVVLSRENSLLSSLCNNVMLKDTNKEDMSFVKSTSSLTKECNSKYFKTDEIFKPDNNDYDSDDEMLSQLDIDNVVCNHEKERS